MEILYIVVPCYNEAECLPQTAPVFRRKLDDLAKAGLILPESRVLLVDDGSSDGTWELIRSLHEADPAFCGLRLSPNRGHQNAVMTGASTRVLFTACRPERANLSGASLPETMPM